MDKGGLPITAILVACALGALGALGTAVDLFLFLYNASSPTNISNSFQPGKLTVMLCLYVALVALLAVVSVKVATHASTHRAVVSNWSPLVVALWFVLSVYLLLVFYPLPPHLHHLDKLLFIIGGLLAWIVWFAACPAGLARTLNGYGYGWVRVGLINFLFFVVLSETALRLIDPVLAKDGLYNREQSSQWLTPHRQTEGSIGRTNSHGFRDRERTIEKPRTDVRVLALGDSFTWGTGVTYDETVVTVLERALQEKLPRSEVINLGVPGFEPEHELDLLRQFGIHLRPDLVVLNFFVGNDIMRKRGVGRESPIVVAGNIFYVHHSGNWVHDHLGPDRWFLYHDLNYLIQIDLVPVRRWFRKQKSTDAAAPASHAPSSDTSPVPKTWNLDYLTYLEERSDIFAKEETQEWKFHWQFTQTTLDSLLQVLQVDRIPMLIVVIPEEVQLDRDLQREFLSTIGASADAYDFQKPQEVLSDWCLSRGVACVDLLAKWANGPSPHSLYFQNDTHWTREGHARAASDIFPILYAQLATATKRRDDAHLGGVNGLRIAP